MKEFVRGKKGVTLVSLTIAIIILVIITSIFVYNSKDYTYTKKLKDLYNDIENLSDKISIYYSKYGAFPLDSRMKYDIEGKFDDEGNSNTDTAPGQMDDGDFYIIDLGKLDGLTLNYGKDYSNVESYLKDDKQLEDLTDIYIMNEKTQNIFYVKGVSIKEENVTKTYYSDKKNGETRKIAVTVKKSTDNTEVYLPEGYKFIEDKVNSSNIKIEKIIKDDSNKTEDEEYQYIWRSFNDYPVEIETNSEGVDELKVWTITNNEKVYKNDIVVDDIYEFYESAKAYNGYFYGVSAVQTEENDENYLTNVVYNPLDLDYWSPVASEDYTYTDKNGDTAFIPKGFSVSRNPSMNQVYNGLVIKDENDNEYVWIDVPKKITNGATNENEIETKLKEYAKDYIDENYSDIWYDGCGLTSNEYNNEKNKMLNSIKNQGGFYISRYEIGDETTTNAGTTGRTNSSGTNGNPVSKKNMYPYTYVTCEEAQGLAGEIKDSNQYSEDLSSNLMFGIQWDLVCKFIENSGSRTRDKLLRNSLTWGNYREAKFSIYRGSYLLDNLDNWSKLNIGDEYKKIVESSLFSTGSSERNFGANIYDLAGNVGEFTLQKRLNDGDSLNIVVGGKCNSNLNESAILNKLNQNVNDSSRDIGFRISLY